MTPEQWARVFSAVAKAAIQIPEGMAPTFTIRYLLNTAAIECEHIAEEAELDAPANR